MELHLPTLLLMLIVGFGVLALELTFARRGLLGQNTAIREWALGAWCAMFGVASYALRQWLPLELSLLIANALSELAFVLFASAVHRFLRGSAPPRWLWWLWGSQVLVILPALWFQQPMRVAVLSASHGLLLLPVLWWLHRAGPRAERSMQLVSLMLGITVVVMAFRAADAALHPQLYDLAAAVGWRQGAAFAAVFLLLLGTGFGFVLANLEQVAHRLEEAARIDGLTGCLNRSAGDKLLEATLMEALRCCRPVALVLMDLDHFKQVNDLHGHRTGDLALQKFAGAAREQLRSGAQLARLGGEEFGLVLPDADAVTARAMADAVRRATEALQLQDHQGRPVRLTVSAGVAVTASGRNGQLDFNLGSLYSRADEALYRAKALGRNRVECASAEVIAVASA